ncbi:unnamed protein product [Discosporangium mesarthrocarpum]
MAITHADALYDSDMDDQDEAWILDQHRPGKRVEESDDEIDAEQEGVAVGEGKERGESKSDYAVYTETGKALRTKKKREKATTLETDAQLSCPLCFTILCLECQRHTRYHTQFRAVFVRNVRVLAEEDVSQRGGKMGRGMGGGQAKGNRDTQQPQEGGSGAGGMRETLRRVCCLECGNEVGVMDQDDVYHFFDVIASG